MPQLINPHTPPSKRIIRILLYLLLSTLQLLFLSGCNRSQAQDITNSTDVEYITKSDFLLNTVVTINLYDKREEDILDGCFDLIKKYELIYSRTNENSELYRLNHRALPEKDGSYMISEELSDIISYGLSYGRISGGLFDITIGSVSSLWDFKQATPELPNFSELLKALKSVNYKYLQLNNNLLTFTTEAVQLDLGAIAKGYIADRVKEYLLYRGVSSAMINLGGNVLCIGEKPNGTPFHVGIQKPFADQNETVAILDVRDMSVVSSGVYERYFEIDGVRYHHLLNPDTGYPVNNELASVTIISKQSMDGDGLSTSCFALGLDRGLELVESLPYTYAVFLTLDGKLYYSKGLKEAIPVYEP